jgi:hypothetical protein
MATGIPGTRFALNFHSHSASICWRPSEIFEPSHIPGVFVTYLHVVCLSCMHLRIHEPMFVVLHGVLSRRAVAFIDTSAEASNIMH